MFISFLWGFFVQGVFGKGGFCPGVYVWGVLSGVFCPDTNFDVFACYRDLWKTDSEKWNTVRQGIINSSNITASCIKVQINAGDKDTATA